MKRNSTDERDDIELEAGPERKPRGIQSVVIGYRILECLAEAETPLGLKELGQAMGMPPSKLRFYLVSFLELGLVMQHGVNGRYGLGPTALKLGLAALEKIDVVRLVSAEIPGLAEQLGYTVSLSVWGSHGPTIVDRVDGRHRTVLEIRVGSVLPLLSSASGLAFAAFMPPAATEALLHREAQEQGEGQAAALSIADLTPTLQAIRAARFARAAGTLLTGFTAIASPVLDRAGMPVAVISMVGAMGKMSDDPAQAPAQALLELTDRLSRGIGWRGPGDKP